MPSMKFGFFVRNIGNAKTSFNPSQYCFLPSFHCICPHQRNALKHFKRQRAFDALPLEETSSLDDDVIILNHVFFDDFVVVLDLVDVIILPKVLGELILEALSTM